MLDSNNKVISVGNPTLNPKVWDLYKQIISGKLSIGNNEITQVEVINKEIQLENIKTGIKHAMTFKLRNIGNIPLVIADIRTSCGCTNANWEKTPIESGESTIIHADITIEHSGYFEKTLKVFSNAEENPIEFIIKGSTK